VSANGDPAARPGLPGAAAPSIRDVARVAGVSHMTVSRVLNAQPNVSAATRERVVAAIAELNFRPSRMARALAHGTSRVIGVLEATGGRHYGPASTIAAIEDAARAEGYSIMIAAIDPADPDSSGAAVEHLLDQGAAGLILVGPGATANGAVADAAAGIPLVVMHAANGTRTEGSATGLPDPAAEDAPSDAPDQFEGGRIAARHLLDLGHRAIAQLAGPAGWLESDSRSRGFVAELAAAGLVPVAVEAGDWTPESGHRAGRALLAAGGFTAVFCANDQMALGMLHAARDAGVAVPAQLSVVGFDDIAEAAHYVPALTTLRQDFSEFGRRAVATVLARLGIMPEPGPAPAPVLIARDSTRRVV
jgi:DNA-binding LacI/PurR family transcriptional regulator